MVCLGLEPGVVGWKAQMNPLSYCCTHPINCFFKKMGRPRPLFVYFLVFSNKHYKFLQQINVKKCHAHPAFGAGIRTHDLWNMSLFP